jgi:hypothetical protein
MMRNTLIKVSESQEIVGMVVADDPACLYYGRILSVGQDSFCWESLDRDGKVLGEDTMPINGILRLRRNPIAFNRRLLERCSRIPDHTPPFS